MVAQPSVWSPDMDRTLAALFNDGSTTKELMEKIECQFNISVTRNSVTGRIYRLRRTTDLIKRSAHSPIIKVPGQRKRKKRGPVAFLMAPEKEVLIAPVDEPVSLMVAFVDLDRKQCHWQTGNSWCGHETVEGKSYCAHHAARVYQTKKVSDEC